MATADLTALVLTNEYPPSVYGGAGIHVGELTRALRERIGLDIRTFGDHDTNEPRFRVRGYPPAHDLAPAEERMRGAWAALSRDLAMAIDPVDADVVHCHTWYTHLGRPAGAGRRTASRWSVTVHSLEPLRPWKREQLGGGYDVSTWVERPALENADAVIAVSHGTASDVLRHFAVAEERIHVIHNGIDAEFWQPDPATDALERYGVDPIQPFVLFVGRITRQKGIVHLVRAIPRLDPGFGVVLCAGAPDTPEIAARDGARRWRPRGRIGPDVIWIQEMLPRATCASSTRMRRVFVLPVGLRAVRDHQPGGDGLRDGRGGQRGGRHPGGGGRRRDRRCWSRSSFARMTR